MADPGLVNGGGGKVESRVLQAQTLRSRGGGCGKGFLNINLKYSTCGHSGRFLPVQLACLNAI